VDTTARVAVDPLVGRLLDNRYAVRERIARGGMATVYAATDTRLDRPVAVKVMHPALAEDPDFVDRFHREARAAARLRSPYAITVTDQGSDAGVVFLVMELVRGRTLRSVLNEHGRIGPSEALDILAPVAEALAAAHAAGIVHRDVKPENVLLGDDGRVQVTDFGLARAIEPSRLTAAAGLLIGTMAYLAPEQVTVGEVDARADVYAAGVMLFEMLVGQPPFDGDTPLAVAYRHVHEDVPAPSDLLPGIPPELDWLVRRATDRDPDARPSDGRALLAEISSARRALARHDDWQSPDRTQPLPYPAGQGQRSGNGRGSGNGNGNGNGQATPRVQHTAAIALDEAETTKVARPQKKSRRRISRGWIVALIVLLISALAGVGAWWLGSGRYVSEPRVLQLSQASAAATLKDAHLAVTMDAPVYSDTVPAGEVAVQQPAAGARVTRGRHVHLALSRGPQRYAVPAVAGVSLAQAKTALNTTHLTFGGTQPASSMTVKKGLVIGTSPAAGAQVTPGTKVTLIMSTGPPLVTIPGSVIGKPADEVAHTLGTLGLTVKTTQANDDHIDSGDVIRIDTGTAGTGAGGMTVPKGTQVTMIVSKGPVMVQVPSLRGLGESAAKRELESVGLMADAQHPVLVGNNVVYQTPGAGSLVPHGSTVTFYLFPG
jgi:serine/threonine-protein kinase